MPEQRPTSALSRLGAVLQPLGLLASLLAALWFARTVWRSGALADAAWRLPGTWGTLAALIGLYAIAGVLLGVGWALALGPRSGDGRTRRRWLIALHCRTQLYKYLPTNTLHLLGRHLLARRAGYGHALLLYAALAEQLLLTLAALALATLALAWLPATGSGVVTQLTALLPSLAEPPIALLVVGVAGAALLLGLGAARRALSATTEGWWHPLRRLLVATGLYLCFFAIATLVLQRVAALFVDAVPPYPQLLLPLTLSWLAGNYVPGSPAGLGIRETVMLALLSALVPAAQGAAIVACWRLVTTGGDALLAALAAAIGGGARAGAG